MKQMKVEEYIYRAIHNAAFDKAKTKGMCWDCSQQAGFAATDIPVRVPMVCKACQKRGVGQP